MKKCLFIFVLAVFLTAGTAFADHPSGTGVGLQGGWHGGWGGGGYGGWALSLKLPSFPIFWAVNMSMGDGWMNFGLSGDYYLIDAKLVSEINLNWYLGVGGWIGLGIADDVFGLSFGARLPIGLSWQPIPLLELFIDVAPSLGVAVVPNFYFPAGGWGGDFGIRLWF